ncbi:MAG TPA: glycosyltransferase [Pirellulales bacterium]|jgi:glycosyltransferase involved in cell wall biosynthesis|nr:glycosyltransferase [Pirellulales bacterium]
MRRRSRELIALDDRGPLRVMFLITSMPVGGAETLLVNLIRRLDRERFQPSLCCLKAPGPLGEALAAEVPVISDLIAHKYDVRIAPRLARIMSRRRIDAIVTVGAGDKMFWGRIAARWAQVPVVLSAIHSTGWPDGIGPLNRSRILTRWTDGFIAVASAHADHLADVEGFPRSKVQMIPNGIDTERFAPADGRQVRRALGLEPGAPVAGIVAALRPEKNHELFLRAAARVRQEVPAARFLIVGDGPLRGRLEELARELKISDAVQFLGTRTDVPQLLSALDVFVLTSRIEANPVSILEAMAMAKPVIAPRVGSIAESVIDGESGFLTDQGDLDQAARRLTEVMGDPERARQLGERARALAVERWSLEQMVSGYERLIERIYREKSRRTTSPKIADSAVSQPPVTGAPAQP